MKKNKIVDKILLLFIGRGKWEYTGDSDSPENGDIRISKIDGKKEIFVDEGPVGGMANFSYWEDIK